MKRTASIDVDEDFEFVCDVTKAWNDSDGRRRIRGVASGVLEDRDGERVSARAIAKMASQPTTGVKLVAATHEQSWLNEIGDVVKLEHDAEHDELIYEAVLPLAGEDPIADKAWKTMTVDGRRMGVSIGGKLRSAFFELVDAAKGPGGGVRKRKVLDEILLRHLCLTDKPSYRQSFAAVVAKTFTGPDDVEFLDEDAAAAVDVSKAKPDPADDAQAQDDAPAQPPAATADEPAPGDDDGDKPEGDGEPSDAEAAADLPMAKRHLSCPNCGHEFAADLPSTDGATEPDPDPKDDADARKSHQETPNMDRTEDTLAKIRALADDDAPVAKTEPEPPAEPEAAAAGEVEKTDTADGEDSEVLKLVAASHRHSEARIEKLAAETQEAVTSISKAVLGLAEAVRSLPTGRRSQARVLPAPGEVEKTTTETDDVQKKLDEAPDALSALKVLNAERGIR